MDTETLWGEGFWGPELVIPETKPMTVEDIFHNIEQQTSDLSIQMIADLKRVVQGYEGVRG